MNVRISIDDIAKIAGVSRGTVSRAFNERSDINAKTREKVLRISKKLNYFPNPSARGLAKGRSECIGIVVPDLKNPFLPEMVSSIGKSAEKYGMSSLLSITDNNIMMQEKILVKMSSGQVDGLLITPCESPESIAMLNTMNSKLPIISLKHFERLQCSSVMFDDMLGAKLIIEHLAELGHKKIAFLSPTSPEWSIKQRLVACNDALQSFNIGYRKHYKLQNSGSSHNLWEEIKELVFSGAEKNPPTAIFAYDDIIALHALKAAESCGLKVPDDISIAGFDNISFSEMAGVPLTTVAVNSERLGETAIDLLMRILKSANRHEEIHHIMLKPELIVRKSTSSPVIK
ncbi:MAG TPA: hypothetical protein DET40_03165 [Lentisphaeria bacterium]|nr:MAG: hypothetical protein A2X45_22325 [Lentisphaerae bacterium GWF2_50_93]HCE42531.1 hypothetical protein [Lentisphaeria bacterium]